MFDYMKTTFAELTEKTKTMPISSLRTRFIIGVVFGVIMTVAVVAMWVITGAISISSPLSILIALGMTILMLLCGVLACFVWAIDWKFMFFPFLAAFHSSSWILFLVNLMIAMVCSIYVYVVGIKGLIRLAVSREK